jgi:low temperature requirement protein LtrA
VRTLSRLLEPPRLRTLQSDQDDDRRATWLELFFDLVFAYELALQGGHTHEASV